VTGPGIYFLLCFFLQIPSSLTDGPAEFAPGTEFFPAITIFLEFETSVPQDVQAAMQQEIEGILNPLGIRVGWSAYPPVGQAEVVRELVVAKFHGTCAPGNAQQTNFRNRTVLGWTHMVDDEVLPFTNVECDKLSGFIRWPMERTHPMEREWLFGRAMGRVLAHELYHVLSRSKDHVAEGIAKQSYSEQDLTEGDLSFHWSQWPTLRAGRVGIEAMMAGGGR
jgi:hypothetical protein